MSGDSVTLDPLLFISREKEERERHTPVAPGVSDRRANTVARFPEQLWENNPMTARQIREQLYPDTTKAQHGTVQRLLQRLEDKGYVERDRTIAVHTVIYDNRSTVRWKGKRRGGGALGGSRSFEGEVLLGGDRINTRAEAATQTPDVLPPARRAVGAIHWSDFGRGRPGAVLMPAG